MIIIPKLGPKLRTNYFELDALTRKPPGETSTTYFQINTSYGIYTLLTASAKVD